MISALPSQFIGRLTPRALGALVAALGLGFFATILLPGFEMATELANTTAALKLVAEQQRYPDLIRTSLESVHDRLATRGYTQAPLDQLREAVGALDAAQRKMFDAQPSGWFSASSNTGAFAESDAAKHTASLHAVWEPLNRSLAPVVQFVGVPYKDSEASGTVLNESGRQLSNDVNTAIHTAHHSLAAIDAEIAALGTELQARNARSATRLRLLMLAGMLGASVLVVLVTVLLAARRRQAHSLREARRQTEDILRTVKEGLFLLDQDLTIGPTYSRALEVLFQRKDFAGLTFDQLLREIVNERTLATALKYVSILWAERTNENLVKSINPLGEVEIRITNNQGGAETRYLEFDFHRVRVEGKIRHVLVSVSDITAQVDLARELKVSQGQAQAQVDTLLGILHVEPSQLASFLSDSNAAMKMINAVLREPARDETAFRKKLDSLFRQAHSVKGEAASLGLSSIESRAHAFEDDLEMLRGKPELSGNDFLPLVIKLDDLLTHLQSISDLVARLSRLHVNQHDDPQGSGVAEIAPSPKRTSASIEMSLQNLARRMADENGKDAELECIGFDAIPEGYTRLVKEIAVQAVRNAIVHGIEARGGRPKLGKPEIGKVRVEFHELPESGYKFTIEDDGRGLSAERIKEVAVQKGLVTAEQAAGLDAKQVFSILFQPGFSTADGITRDAGRGVGMNLISERVHDVGGRVGVATSVGKFTRITLSLPALGKRANTTEAA
jgi:HPt (histidine-containing phosphotransfer) domain-containing protein/PAS domain-containing protein